MTYSTDVIMPIWSGIDIEPFSHFAQLNSDEQIHRMHQHMNTPPSNDAVKQSVIDIPIFRHQNMNWLNCQIMSPCTTYTSLAYHAVTMYPTVQRSIVVWRSISTSTRRTQGLLETISHHKSRASTDGYSEVVSRQSRLLIYTPSYTPNVQTIEMTWAYVKRYVTSRYSADRTVTELIRGNR